MNDRLKPEKVKGHKARARVIESEKSWFKFQIQLKNREKKEENNSNLFRIQKVEKKTENIYKQPLESSYIHLLYLTKESLKGLYKEPEKNLPYEILDVTMYPIYRQRYKEKKEKIFNELEQAAVNEGLR